jgi:hypothetical protein
MDDAERFLLLGRYRTPWFRVGHTVVCEVRGQVVITGMSDAPIPSRSGDSVISLFAQARQG